MIGTHPTIGCLIVFDKASFAGAEKVVQALQRSIPISSEQLYEAGASHGHAALGGEMPEMIVITQETDEGAFVQIEFDEDETVNLARTTKTSFEQLLMPYVQAAKTLPGVLAVALGFELSPPADLREQSLRDAGVAVLFTRDEQHESWSRKETSPMVGHYL